MDVGTLLPKDVSSDGFDNVAATLRISPAFLDQYISAARAREPPGHRPCVGQAEHAANTASTLRSTSRRHIDGLPLGTRGGIVVEHYFPADGEYEFNIRDFLFMGAGYVTKIDDHAHA